MRGKRYIYTQDLWSLAVVNICSCFSHLGLWVMAIDQRTTEWLLPSSPELISLAKKNPHFLLFLKGLAVQFRNTATQKQIASGRGRKTKLGERWKRGRKGYKFKRGMRHTASRMEKQLALAKEDKVGILQETRRQLSFQWRKGAWKEWRNWWACRPCEFMKPLWYRGLLTDGRSIPPRCCSPYSMIFSTIKNKHSQHEHTLQ